ncbi:hypothetical protein NKG94_32715 [Micromonospora sp. M12]
MTKAETTAAALALGDGTCGPTRTPSSTSPSLVPRPHVRSTPSAVGTTRT